MVDNGEDAAWKVAHDALDALWKARVEPRTPYVVMQAKRKAYREAKRAAVEQFGSTVTGSDHD